MLFEVFIDNDWTTRNCNVEHLNGEQYAVCEILSEARY